MYRKLKMTYETIATKNGLNFDEELEMIYGEKNGYNVFVKKGINGSNLAAAIFFTINSNGRKLTKDEQKDLKKAISKAGKFGLVTIQGYRVIVNVAIKLDGDKSADIIREAIEKVIKIFMQYGYENCCQECGQSNEADIYVVTGIVCQLCEECYNKFSSRDERKAEFINTKTENVIGGIVGAVVGSLIGVACIVLLGQIGYVAAASGMVMAICSLKGYEIIGGKLSNKGIIISVIVMIVMTFFANQLSWALEVISQWSVEYGEKISLVDALSVVDYIASSQPAAFYGHLALIYLFNVLGVVPTIKNTKRNEDLRGTSFKL